MPYFCLNQQVKFSEISIKAYELHSVFLKKIMEIEKIVIVGKKYAFYVLFSFL